MIRGGYRENMGILHEQGCLLMLFLVATVSCQSKDSCPVECDCTRPDHLTCRNLTSFPLSFSSTAEIVSIYLSRFSVIPTDAFLKLPNMKILDMYSVDIRTIESCAFHNLHNMSRISIYNAKIGTIKAGAFKGLLYDGYFSLYMSEVETIEPYAFSDISNTKSFAIFDTNITTIESRAFHKFQDITKFSVYSSNISHVHSGSFDDFNRIQLLHIQENFIRRLDCNTVETLARGFEEAFSFDKILVKCDCPIRWLRELAGSIPSLPLTTIICKQPVNLDGAALTALDASQFCPGAKEAGTGCASLPPGVPPTCSANGNEHIGQAPEHKKELGHEHAKERHPRHDHDHDDHDHGSAHPVSPDSWRCVGFFVFAVWSLL